MSARPLRAVDSDEPPAAPTRSLSVAQAAAGGDRRELLIALRTRIARTVASPKTAPRDLAALSRRLLEIAKEIEAIDADGGHDDISAAASTPDEEWAAT